MKFLTAALAIAATMAIVLAPAKATNPGPADHQIRFAVQVR